MRAFLSLSLALAVLAAAPVASAGEEPPLEGLLAGNFRLLDPPVPAPKVALTDGFGEEITLDAYRGKVVLVNFWATWCAPCVREMPSLDRVQADLGEEGLVVVPVSADRGGAEVVDRFYRDYGLTNLAIYLDPRGKMQRAIGVAGLPTTVLVNREGEIVGGIEGPFEWDGPEAEALIRYYLERPPES